MNVKTYSFTINAEAVDEMTNAEYSKLREDASSVFETPEEYGDYAYVMRAVNEAGEAVWLGIKWPKRGAACSENTIQA